MAFGTATVLTNVGMGITGRMVAAEAQNTPKFLGIGTGATGAARTAVAGDTALTTEVETRAGGNSPTAETTTETDDTFQAVQTITATAARAVDEAGMFDASTTGLMYLSATFPVVNLETDDSLQITAQVQYT